MKARLFVLSCLVLFAFSCRKEADDTMLCEISGRILVWDVENPAQINPAALPSVELYKLKLISAGDPMQPPKTVKERITEVPVGSDGRFIIEHDLKKGVEYFITVINHDTNKYLNIISSKVEWEKSQTVNAYLAAVSWVKPRFINQTNLPGDTFTYISGIGGGGWIAPFIGPTDTIVPWLFKTWGGTQINDMRHSVGGILSRNGISRDTLIFYSVPPGDTSLVEIRW